MSDQRVKVLVSQIMKEVSVRVREIVREEIDIEKKRLKRQLLEEIQEELGFSAPLDKMPVYPVKPTRTPAKPSPKLNVEKSTGNEAIDKILEETEVTNFDMIKGVAGINANSSTFQQVADQMSLQEQQKTNHGPLWKPPEGEAYNFDPKTMDPAQIDWNQFIDKVEKTA